MDANNTTKVQKEMKMKYEFKVKYINICGDQCGSSYHRSEKQAVIAARKAEKKFLEMRLQISVKILTLNEFGNYKRPLSIDEFLSR